MASNGIIKVGIGVWVLKDGKVLMGKRKRTGIAEDVYASPGGHLEFGESFEECAIREVKEETGMEIENIRVVTLANLLHWKDKHYVDVGMEADWKSGEPQLLEPDKCESWDWYDIKDLPSPMMTGDDLRVKGLETGQLYFGTLR